MKTNMDHKGSQEDQKHWIQNFEPEFLNRKFWTRNFEKFDWKFS